jgi:NRAMP (natural resistance-associated macrophage protein)-like metal ion transporter
MPQPPEPSPSQSPTIPHKPPAGGTASLEAAGKKKQSGFRKFLSLLGPGLITGASDDDPSGIATYSTAGASLGFSPLWTAPASLPLMATIQYICAKIGMVSGDGLGRVLRKHYPRWVLYPAMLCLVVANTINAGADMGAIAVAFQLFVPIPTIILLLLIASVVMAFQIWGNYRLIANIFKWLTITLFAYIGAALVARPNWAEVMRGTFIPQLAWNHEFLTTLVAILGTTISPYLFFWQASQEVEEEISAGRVTEQQRQGATDKELKFAALDVNIGMLFSNLVFYFVILATAATLHAAGQTQIETATDAAKALEPLAGKGAFVLFALGIIGSGFLAVPVLTGATGYAVCEALNWKHGLDKKPHHAKRFYAIIIACTMVGVAVDLIGINPMRALFLTAVLNGILAPPLLVIIMLVSNNKKVMGKRTNSWWINALGWITTAVMFAAAIAMFVV